MAFWSRGPKKVRPDAWIRDELQKLLPETKSVEALVAQQIGVGYPSSADTLAAAAPAYQALARLAGKTEALKGLAFYQRLHGSLDERLFDRSTRLNDFVSSFYRDYQQSLGLMLFYPDLNGRLLPPDFTAEQYDEALRIGAEARGKFVEFWAAEGSKYSDNQGGPADSYAALMRRYTTETGRPAARLEVDKPPEEMVPPYRPANLEYRDGQWHPVKEGG